MFTVIGKFGNVQYKDENSQRIGIGLSTIYGNINYRKTFGYAGELDAVSVYSCLLYTSDAADERSSVDFGGRRIIKQKN